MKSFANINGKKSKKDMKIEEGAEMDILQKIFMYAENAKKIVKELKIKEKIDRLHRELSNIDYGT